MHAQISTPRLCRDDGQESARAAMLAEFDTNLANLKRCVHWLVEAGIAILDADMRRGRSRPVVTVAASTHLHVLFRDDCANVGRRQEGVLTYSAWQALRHGVTIRWEEVCA